MAVMVGGNVLTREDLDTLPDNGLRRELIDGSFVMSPAPGVGHQRVVVALYRTLWAACQGTDLEVLLAPLDVVLGTSVVEPDVVVAARSAYSDRDLPVAPLLAVEVLSASSAWLDKGRKLSLYEEHGVASYWIVDPAGPSITVLELEDGCYVQTGSAYGDESVEIRKPFVVNINPAVLNAG